MPDCAHDWAVSPDVLLMYPLLRRRTCKLCHRIETHQADNLPGPRFRTKDEYFALHAAYDEVERAAFRSGSIPVQS